MQKHILKSCIGASEENHILSYLSLAKASLRFVGGWLRVEEKDFLTEGLGQKKVSYSLRCPHRTEGHSKRGQSLFTADYFPSAVERDSAVFLPRPATPHRRLPFLPAAKPAGQGMLNVVVLRIVVVVGGTILAYPCAFKRGACRKVFYLAHVLSKTGVFREVC